MMAGMYDSESQLSGWRRLVSVEWMILGVWIIAFALYVALQKITDTDTPWHLTTGLYILHYHLVPTHDPFSWSMRGKPWVTQEWLFEVVFAWLEAVFRFAGAWLLLVAVHTATVLVLYRQAVRASDGHRVVAALVACAGTLAAIVFWILRPQIVDYLMFATFLWILQQVREGSTRVLWLVPPLLWIWTNAHSASVIGVLLLLVEVALSFVPDLGRLTAVRLSGGQRVRMLIAAAVGLVVGLLNPNGIKAYTYALLSTNRSMTNNIIEWHSPDFHTAYFEYGVLPFLIVTFLILFIRWGDLPMRETLVFGGCFALTLIHQRFMPFLALSTVPLLAAALSDWGRSLLHPSRVMQVINAGVLLVMVAMFVWASPGLRGSFDDHLDTGTFPAAAVNFLKQQHYAGPLLNSYRYGGYLIYKGIPPFIDGRTDIYLRSTVFSDYLAMKNMWWNGPQLIRQYGFRVAIFPAGYTILTYLTQDLHWRVAYQDATAEIVVRPTGQ